MGYKVIKVVPQKSRNQLRTAAYMLRKKFGLEKEKMFPIVWFLEFIMPQVDPMFTLDPVEDDELRGRAAETIPTLHTIRIKQSIYNAACAGNHWARFVLAHELGHYIFHSTENVAYALSDPNEKIPRSIDPEKQADDFADELLVPVNLINEPTEYLVSKHFGVPRGTARIQMGQVARIAKRHQRKKQFRQKKNG